MIAAFAGQLGSERLLGWQGWADDVADDPIDDRDGLLFVAELDEPWRSTAGTRQLKVLSVEETVSHSSCG